MKKYCFIQHPQRGRIPFHLYPFQEKVLHLWRDNLYDIILKSRQLGISTLVAGYALWKMIFNEDFNVLIIANKQDVAKNLVLKVRTMNQLLPVWLRVAESEDNKLSLRLHNGSQIKAIAMEPSLLLMFPSEYMQLWMDKYRSWREYILQSYHTRMLELMETIDEIAFMRLDERLIKYLTDQAKLLGNLELHHTHQQIADDLHSSRVVISRLLKQLENKGAIQIRRNRIILNEI